MKALILNGALKEDKALNEVSQLAEEIFIHQGYEVGSILLRENIIADYAFSSNQGTGSYR